MKGDMPVLVRAQEWGCSNTAGGSGQQHICSGEQCGEIYQTRTCAQPMTQRPYSQVHPYKTRQALSILGNPSCSHYQ